MPTITANDVDLFYEVTGQGAPLVLLHEYATDMRAWESQVRFFSRFYKVIRFNYRGYPPSSVPKEPDAYLHDRFIDDIEAIFVGLGIEQAHLVGIATGGNLALNFALRRPEKVLSLVVIGAGAGTSNRQVWLEAAAELADGIASRGVQAVIDSVSTAPQRIALKHKDPIAWEMFLMLMTELDPFGAEQVMRTTLTGRLPITDLEQGLLDCQLPVLVMMGDQDSPAEQACRFIVQHAPHAGLAVLANCGHTLNLEEPAMFNQLVGDFLAAVSAGRWGTWVKDKG